MHISEGVLSAPVLISGIVASAVGTGIGLKQIKTDDVPKVALLSCSFFVASLIHVPVGLGSIHLVLNGLLGIILGWKSFPSILIALLLQVVLFQFGGLTVLGVNTLIMAFPSVMVYYLFRNTLKSKGKILFAGGFLSGALSILFSSLLLAIALYFSDEAMYTPAKVILLANIPLIIIEGFITAFAVVFIKKVKPEMFGVGIERGA